MSILYPETSLLDTFMEKQGLHKKLRHNIKIVNGEVKFNRFQKNKKANKTVEVDSQVEPEENNFFAKKKQDQQKAEEL